MGGGNGAKAAQKRERNAKNAASTTKSGEKPKLYVCQGCFSKSLMITQKALMEQHHTENTKDARHSKFPNYQALFKVDA